MGIFLAQIVDDLFGRFSAAARAVNNQVKLVALELVLRGHESLDIIDPDSILRLHRVENDVALGQLAQLLQEFPTLGIKRIAPNSELLLESRAECYLGRTLPVPVKLT